MGYLHEGVRVACPYTSAEAWVRAYVVERGTDRAVGTESAQFNMRLEPATLRALGFEPHDRGVHVVMRSRRGGDRSHARYRIRWRPERAGPHTMFFGELALQHSERRDQFALRLDGRFESSREAERHASEHVASTERVAIATANALLEQIETFVTDAADTERTRGDRHTNGVSHGHVG